MPAHQKPMTSVMWMWCIWGYKGNHFITPTQKLHIYAALYDSNTVCQVAVHPVCMRLTGHIESPAQRRSWFCRQVQNIWLMLATLNNLHAVKLLRTSGSELHWVWDQNYCENIPSVIHLSSDLIVPFHIGHRLWKLSIHHSFIILT